MRSAAGTLAEGGAGYGEAVRLGRPESALDAVAAVAYVGAFASVVYIGDFRFSEALFLLAPLAFGAAVPRWWAVAIPLLVLLPLPIVLAFFPPDIDSELSAVGVGFLVVFWTLIQSVLVAVAIGVRYFAGALLSARRQLR